MNSYYGRPVFPATIAIDKPFPPSPPRTPSLKESPVTAYVSDASSHREKQQNTQLRTSKARPIGGRRAWETALGGEVYLNEANGCRK